jgi:hypothetical protein
MSLRPAIWLVAYHCCRLPACVADVVGQYVLGEFTGTAQRFIHLDQERFPELVFVRPTQGLNCSWCHDSMGLLMLWSSNRPKRWRRYEMSVGSVIGCVERDADQIAIDGDTLWSARYQRNKCVISVATYNLTTEQFAPRHRVATVHKVAIVTNMLTVPNEKRVLLIWASTDDSFTVGVQYYLGYFDQFQAVHPHVPLPISPTVVSEFRNDVLYLIGHPICDCHPFTKDLYTVLCAWIPPGRWLWFPEISWRVTTENGRLKEDICGLTFLPDALIVWRRAVDGSIEFMRVPMGENDLPVGRYLILEKALEADRVMMEVSYPVAGAKTAATERWTPVNWNKSGRGRSLANVTRVLPDPSGNTHAVLVLHDGNPPGLVFVD